jgi:hypothetical protein
MTKKKDLVQIIRDNPGCVAVIDNDSWWLYPAPPKPVGEMSDDEYDDWRDVPLATDGNIAPLGDGGYGSGNCYGGDILQALAVIVGIKIESV